MQLPPGQCQTPYAMSPPLVLLPEGIEPSANDLIAIALAAGVSSCDDGNPCTYDYCNAGRCEHEPTRGNTCGSDFNPCTNDFCVEGFCTHPARTGTCADDGNVCTDDVCVNKVCTHPARTGTCPNDGNPCTDDVCVNKVCTHPPNNSPCVDDGNVCTDDYCVDGICRHIGMSVGLCDQLGSCFHGKCDIGGCIPLGGYLGYGVCADEGNPCTWDACDSTGTCVHPPRSGSCADDGNPCTDDLCVNGACSHPPRAGTCPDDGNNCTSDVCNQGQCTHPPTSGQCELGPCYENEHCADGDCVGDWGCDDGNLCTTDGCNTLTGCYHVPLNCNDIDPCTVDSCVNGECRHGHSNCEEAEDPCNPDPVLNFYPACDNCSITFTVPLSLRTNCDDDDDNGVVDSRQAGPIVGENDLAAASLFWTPGCAQMGGAGQSVVWRIAEGSGNRTYRVFRNPDKTSPVDALSGYSPWPPPSTVWVEGIEATGECPSRFVAWVGVTYSGGGYCIYCGYEADPITVVEAPLVVYGDRIDQDDPTSVAWAPLAEADPVYGGSEASTADNLKLTVQPNGAVSKVVWSASGTGRGTWNPPPTAPDAETWDLGDILNPTPGEIEFWVHVLYADGRRECGRFASEIGVRTDDVILVAWIDGNNVPLNPAGVNAQIVAIMPPAGPPVPSNFDCNDLVGDLYFNDNTPNGINPLTGVDRTYILNWLFKFAGNSNPSSGVIPGGDFRNAANTFQDESEVAAFYSLKTNYKLFNRLQIKYLDDGAPQVIHQPTGIGDTVNPCGPWGPALAVYPGQSGPANGPPAIVLSNRVTLINDGSPDAGAIRAFNTLMGNGVAGTPVFWENIGSSIKFYFSGATSPVITLQPYPTYYEYRNGRFFGSTAQAAQPAGNFVPNPYPFGTVECYTPLVGTTPGGRCGDAVSPADASARIPPYTVP